MKTLEIIHLRLAGQGVQELIEAIRDSVARFPVAEVVTFYRRSHLPTDLAIHIHHPAGQDAGGRLALSLVGALKEHGLVEHSIWEEIE